MNKMELREVRRLNLKRLISEMFGDRQAEFSVAIKKSPSQINHWLTGHRNPNGDTCRDVERAVGVLANWLDECHDGIALKNPHQPIADFVQNNPLAVINQAQTAINVVASLDQSLDGLIAHLGKVSPAKRAAIGGLLAVLAADPEDPQTRDALAAMLKPSGFVETQKTGTHNR